MPETLGDGPIQKEYHEAMNKIASGLDEIFNGDRTGDDRETGFVLLTFGFNDTETKGGESRCNFISNGADRRDIVALFKEMIARFEGQAEPPTGHA